MLVSLRRSQTNNIRQMANPSCQGRWSIFRAANAIDIEFATLPGHEDGPGSTIHFRWTEQGAAPSLDIRGYVTGGPGSGDGPFSAPARVGYTALAELVWQPYVTLGAIVAPVVAFAILVYRWMRRRTTTSWPLVTAMVVTLVVIAGLAFLDSPSTASMLFH